MKRKTDIDLKSIGQRLRTVREQLGLTLEKIGEITGMSKSLISAAEKGEKKPSSIYLCGLINQFNVNINYILAGKGDMFLDNRNKTEEEKDINELFLLMEKVKMLRYSVLGYYHEYKKRNRDIIEEFLDE